MGGPKEEAQAQEKGGRQSEEIICVMRSPTHDNDSCKLHRHTPEHAMCRRTASGLRGKDVKCVPAKSRRGHSAAGITLRVMQELIPCSDKSTWALEHGVSSKRGR